VRDKQQNHQAVFYRCPHCFRYNCSFSSGTRVADEVLFVQEIVGYILGISTALWCTKAINDVGITEVDLFVGKCQGGKQKRTRQAQHVA
jgi:hypothetical protein